MKIGKRIGALIMSLSMLGTMIGGMPAYADEANVDEATIDEVRAEAAGLQVFDPETTLWTNNPIENVLAEGGVYETMRDVDPNADKKATVNVQKPYEKKGVNFTGWGYSEYIWSNGYPVGNGRMASMVAGGIDNEVIQINEETCWDGGPYGTLKNEKGETLTTIEQTRDAETITAVDMTSGSVEGNWKYFRGAKEDGTPAEIGSADAIVGDEAFREAFPDFANKSLSNQALNIDNSKTQTAVQDRYNLHSMVEAKFLGNPTGQRAYKSFVELYLDFGQDHNYATNYTKSLDMTTGIVKIDYDYLDMNDRTQKHFTRETFASYPDQAVVTHVTSDSPLDFTAELHTYHNQEGYYKFEKVSDKQVKVTASVYNGNKDNNIGRINVIKFESDMLLDGDGEFSVSEDNTTVSVKGGNEATIYVVGATNYVNYKELDNSKPATDCAKYIANIQSKSYDTILARHIADFTEQFSSSSLTLENINGVDNYLVPTEKRVRKDVNGKSGYTVGSGADSKAAASNGVKTTYSDGDNQLATLEFNYGKYMMMSGARDERTAEQCGEGDIEIPMSQPLNLTGKWNAAMSAGWNGKYTININTEMNYWAAQPLNIGASEKTLIDTFADLAESGSITAAYQYGVFNDRGDDTYQPGDPWVMHHNFDLWRGTQPIDNATAGLWPTGGAWLLDHAWQYYRFNLDEEYLAEIYPYMVGAAKFFTQFLVVDPKTGYLITAASCSPEQGGVQPGPAMDTQLVRNLYDMVQQASEILGKTEENAELLAKIAEQMPSSYLADEKGKVAPNLIASNGFIEEWTRGDVTFEMEKKTDTSGTFKDITNPFKSTDTTKSINAKDASNNTGHRHMSHLWELFPGTHLSAYSDDANEQKIYNAFKNSIVNSNRYKADGKGWSLAWRINLLARSLEGTKASSKLEQLFLCRTAPNLLDEHPDFQIDGNYGATSGITEMLLQSHDGNINILPALPSSWKSGEFKDFRARGDVGVSAKWQDGKFIKAELKPENDGDLNVIVADIEKATVTDSAGQSVAASLNSSNKIMTFTAKAGETYTVSTGNPDVPKPEATERPVPTSQPTIDPDATPKPTATPEPTQPPLPDYWTCGSSDSSKKSGEAVMKNMTLLFDVSSSGAAKISIDGKSFTNYISSGDNGSWTNGIATGTALKYTAEKYGTLTVYVTSLGGNATEPEKGKELCITKEGVSNNKQNVDGESAYYKNTTGSSINKSLSIDVTPGNTYYAYVAGSKGRFVGAEFTASTEQPTTPPSADYDYEITNAYFGSNGNLTVDISYQGEEAAPKAKLIVGVYDENDEDVLLASDVFDIEGTEVKDFFFVKPDSGKVKLYIWDSTDSMRPLSDTKIPNDSTPATPEPTNPPSTAAPTATPAATTDPALTGVFIGATKYDTVRDAVAAAAGINPTSEAERVYIDITPGTYREQVVVNTPYVTIRRKPGTSGEVKLTWYYGLGTLYDSCNSSGYYDPSVVGDGEAYGPKDWGPSLKVDKKATAFIAENLYLENSYNAYYTQEELTDIAGVDPDTNNSMFHRLEWIQEQLANSVSDDEINNFLQSRTNITYKDVNSSPRERCAALHCSADKAQFINCTVMSTQDTIGINTGRMYFKNCKLGGTTDYICGSATAVFDGCELYANAGDGGDSATITAPSNPIESDGYLFYNCHVTGSSKAGQGNFGRPWSGVNASANYINTKIDSVGGNLLIGNAGWTSMSGVEPKDARFHEYGSVDSNGNAVSTSARPKSTLLDEWTMLRYNPLMFNLGSDGWDPAGLAQTYAGVNGVIDSTVIDTSDNETNEITLPTAPSGYEFKWESNSEFAEVSADGTKLVLVRPAYGEVPINATVKLYARESANKHIGAEKSISFDIQPTSDVTNVFTVSGTVTLSVASENAQNVCIQFKKGEAVIKTVNVEIPAGVTSVPYTAANIPSGTYTATASTDNAEYNILTADTEITGATGDAKTFNVDVKKMQNIKVESPDFDGAGYSPTITSASGFSAGVYTATGSETANLGEAGNKVYKLTKDEGKTVAASTGVSFDVKSMLPSGSSFANTKTITFSYDLLMESTALYPSEYTYLDLATSKTNAGKNDKDQTRFVRWGVHKGWGQLNFFTAMNNRVNGDNTQFDKNNTMANRWYRIKADIDLITKSITTTIYDRDKNMEILNKKPFNIAVPDEAGDNPNYPTAIDLNNLYFNIYMDKNANTSNKMEYYIDNITIEYQDYE
ncbi:MAG: pectinesterase family protein [Clostridiales bacterium]|nr:pectinesterase family protein [Clostridiales bacterium]